MTRALFPDLVVNGETVPHAAVAAEAQNHAAPRGKPGLAWRKAANAMAVRALLLQEARRRRLEPQPRELAPGRFETDEEAVIRGLLEQAIVVDPPSEAEVEREWMRDPSRFRSPPLWDVSHILCACDPHDETARQGALQRARDLIRRIRDHPGLFAELARDHSDCGSKSAGGSLGQLRPGDAVPEFDRALRDLREGQITPDPVLSRYGWHIIRINAVADGAILPFDAVRARIADAMEKAGWARMARAFVDQLADTAEISGADLKSAMSRS